MSFSNGNGTTLTGSRSLARSLGLLGQVTWLVLGCSGTSEPGAAGSTGGAGMNQTIGGVGPGTAVGTAGGSVATSGGVTGATFGGSSPGTASGGTTSASGTVAGTAVGTGGNSELGGTTSLGAGGVTSKGGSSAAGGATSKGGSSAAGGVTSKGGSSAAGGVTSKGGSSAAGGSSTVPSACGSTIKVNRNPFNCKFGWGSSTQANANFENFVTRWTGYETNGGLASWTATANGANCGACGLVTALAKTQSIPAFYTYWIGYQARTAGFGDCNVDMTDGHNLCTDGAAWILSNWQTLIRAYAEYARMVEAAAPGRASLWLLEGDLSQYVNSGQQSPRPLTWTELGQLVTDIICAIKSNHPNAMVYLNHSYWLTTDTTTGFFSHMPMAMVDGLWMGGGANLSGKLTPATYTTVTYAWLHSTTGLPLYVGGQGASQQNWATATTADLNARIADGVVAADIDPEPTNVQTVLQGYATSLTSTCK